MIRAAALTMGILAVLGGAASSGAADSDALKAKLETCFACHGEGGVSQTENVPSIAAEPSYFTQWQLVFFRSGSRKSEIMEPVAAGLSNEDLKAIGAYLESLAPPRPPKSADDTPDMTKVGARLAEDRHCSSCHKSTCIGQQAAGRLAGQREEVLLKALKDYKSGVRTGSGVAAMPEVAYSLNEDQMKALAHYLARLP